MAWTITVHDAKGNVKEHKINLSKETEDAIENGGYTKIWCNCKNPDRNNLIYKKNYLGVNHGYVCPKCKKYVEIG